MASDILVRTESGRDLRRAIVVVGTPTLGLVGAIVGNHLVRALKMAQVGDVRSRAFAPVLLVKDGLTSSPVRMFALDAECGPALVCSRIIVVTSEFPLPGQIHRRLAEAIVRWAREHDAGLVLVPDAIPADDDGEERTYGVATSSSGLDFLRAIGVPVLESGILGGLSGALVEEGSGAGVEVVALLGETHPALPDARAAARIVTLLGKVLPGVPMEVDKLLEEAEEIECAVREARARMPEGGAEPETPMFS